MKKVVALAVSAGLLASGCASTKTVPLDPAKLAEMNNQTIASTDSPLPPFSATKSSGVAAGALFGAVGGAAMAIRALHEGEIIVKTNGVQDPADMISARLTERLAAAGSAKVGDVIVIDPKIERQQTAVTPASAQYLLSVNTLNWGTLYYVSDWSHYGVLYSARMQLIEVSTNKVIAVSFCQVSPEKKPGVNAPTFDELVADGAARLKALLDEAGQTCLAKFTSEALKI